MEGPPAPGSPDLSLFSLFPTVEEQIEDIAQASEVPVPAVGTFITEDEIDRMLIEGPHISESKLRIYSYFMQGHDAKECVSFLKDNYGIGGYSRVGYDEWHDGKGIRLSREDGLTGKKYDTVTLNWAQVQKRIRGLIDSGRYLSQEEQVRSSQYEKEHLARSISTFFRGIPNSTSPSEWDAKTILPLLEDPEQVEKLFNRMLSDFAPLSPDTPHYTEMQFALRDVGMYQSGVSPLFTPLPETALRAERRVIQAAKEAGRKVPVPQRTTLEAPPVSGDRLADAARTLAQKMQPNTRESENGQLSLDLFGAPAPEPPAPPHPVAPPRKPVVVETILSPDLEAERQQQIAAEEKEAAAHYDLGYGHMGNGLTVWNRLDEEDGDYKIVAHIAPDRTVAFYDQDMPEAVKAQIRKTAMTTEMSISTTQDVPVFSVPPQVPEQEQVKAGTGQTGCCAAERPHRSGTSRKICVHRQRAGAGGHGISKRLC